MNKFLAKAKSIAIALLLGAVIIPLGLNLYSLMVMAFNDGDAMPLYFTPYYITRSYSDTDEIDAIVHYMDYRGFVLSDEASEIMHFIHPDGREEYVNRNNIINLFSEDMEYPYEK